MPIIFGDPQEAVLAFKWVSITSALVGVLAALFVKEKFQTSFKLPLIILISVIGIFVTVGYYRYVDRFYELDISQYGATFNSVGGKKTDVSIKEINGIYFGFEGRTSQCYIRFDVELSGSFKSLPIEFILCKKHYENISQLLD